MSDRRDQSVPSPGTRQPEDAWWDAVYGPGGVDSASAARAGTIDDWFASALGAMGATVPPPAPAPDAVQDTAPADAAVIPAQPDDPTLPPPPDTPPVPRTPAPPQIPPIPLIPPRPSRPPRVSADPRVVAPRPELRTEAARPDRQSEEKVAEPSAPGRPAAVPEPGPAVPAAPASAGPDRVTGLDAGMGLDRAADPEAGDAHAVDRAGRPPGPGDDDRPAAPPPALGDELLAPPAPPRQDDDDPDAPAPTLVGEPLAPPPHVPTPTLPDGASARWGRNRPPVGARLPDPDALPEADPDALAALVPDTALDLAHHGSMTLRAATARGEEARALGLPRTDRLLVARFGEGGDGLLVVVIAAGPAGVEVAPAARMLAAAVGRSRAGLLADLREGAQERLRYGLQRLTARATRELGAGGALHALIAPLDPTNRLRAGFGTGPGALLLLGDDAWYDAYAGRRLTSDPEATPAEPDRFRFRAVVPEPGDVLLLCSEGLAAPLRAEPAVAALLAEHWSLPHAPSGVDFLRQVQARAQGHSADRTAAAIWEE
ncbi:hypothetical protein [Streptacidiphilus rugosus]|uniref:hypothetical protein n=1 Tax=Streptacidiphilus rugosus TaxID=405783 RepID=UPI000AE9B4EF|nr:hypothetical protein [Streptacidiphilus rugosus]